MNLHSVFAALSIWSIVHLLLLERLAFINFAHFELEMVEVGGLHC